VDVIFTGYAHHTRSEYSSSNEVQSKVDLLSAPPMTVAEATVQVEHQLNLARSCETDRENGYENRSPVLAMSDPLAPTNHMHSA